MSFVVNGKSYDEDGNQIDAWGKRLGGPRMNRDGSPGASPTTQVTPPPTGGGTGSPIAGASGGGSPTTDGAVQGLQNASGGMSSADVSAQNTMGDTGWQQIGKQSALYPNLGKRVLPDAVQGLQGAMY